jgi:hypothetical protein
MGGLPPFAGTLSNGEVAPKAVLASSDVQVSGSSETLAV